MNFTKLAIVAALGLAISSAQAASFNFSYAFGDGNVASGSFDGTANGNLITNLSNIATSLNGVAFQGSGNLFGSHYDSNYGWVSGGAVASFDGTQNNFLIIDSDYPNNYGYSNYFYAIGFNGQPTSSTASYNSHNGQFASGNFEASRWTMTSAVPEPESYAMMLGGLAVLGAFARRRKGQKA